MLHYFVLFLIFIGVLFWIKPSNSAGNRLPGPIPLPLLGNIFQVGFQPHLTFTKWAKRYGPIYGIKLGSYYSVVISNHKLIKELFNDTASTGRMTNNAVAMEFTNGPYGMGNLSGPTWESQRKFTVSHLRNLGFAKTSMETMILEEVQIMLDWFKKHEGSPILGTRIFNAPVVNSLWRITTGERCRWEETRPAILDAMEELFLNLLNTFSNGLLVAPFLRYIAPNVFGWNRLVKNISSLFKLFDETITKHEETFNSAELRDYVDHYLFKISATTDEKSSFYKDTGKANMKAILSELFFAGSESTSASISWLLLYLSQYQNVQKILQKEIEEVIGSTLPSLSNRSSMPYCEAVISEVLRISSLAALGGPHIMLSDLVFHGYHLPKDALVLANLYAVHHDPEIWGDPEKFRPDRFLNEDGTKFVQNEALIPFAEGKRKCIGEKLARDTMFLFVASIFQHFNVLPDPDNKMKTDFGSDYGIGLIPKPFKIVMSPKD